MPIDLFGPFTDTCVEVIKPIVLELPNSACILERALSTVVEC